METSSSFPLFLCTSGSPKSSEKPFCLLGLRAVLGKMVNNPRFLESSLCKERIVFFFFMAMGSQYLIINVFVSAIESEHSMHLPGIELP